MISASEYDRATGLFTGVLVTTPNVSDLLYYERADNSTAFAEGRFDRNLQRIDPATKALIEASAEQRAAHAAGPPTRYHEWDALAFAWIERRTVERVRQDRIAAEHQAAQAVIDRTLTRGGLTMPQVLALADLGLLADAAGARGDARLGKLRRAADRLVAAENALRAARTLAEVDAVPPADHEDRE